MIYLVGGAPRVGKSQFAKAVVKFRPMHAISTDAVRYMLRRSPIGKDVLQKLKLSSEADVLSKPIDQLLADQNNESRALWPFLIEIMKSYEEEGDDVLIEGVAILPELTQQLTMPHKTIILSNTSETHIETTISQAESNEYDWLYKYDPAEKRRYAEFFQFMDLYLLKEADKNQVTVGQINDSNFAGDLNAVADVMINT
jgi:2-phosphoglycerate kinase